MAFANYYHDISKHQRVQNAAARLITNARKYDHITATLFYCILTHLCFTAFILKF